MNRRVAAHMKGKPATTQVEAHEQATSTPGSRAAKAAARVAKRFAKAPSYNEVLANDARAAVEAAEAASLAAQEAHAKAQMVLAGIEAATEAQPAADPFRDPFWESRVADVVPIAAAKRQAEEPAMRQAQEIDAAPQVEYPSDHFAIRWEPDMPLRTSTPEEIRASLGPSLFETATADWEEIEPEPAQPPVIEVIEPALPILGNVIEFPRQIVATRKVRPRLAEGPLASSADSVQLSIFEVDPAAVSVEPEVQSPVATDPADAWNIPDWSAMRLAPEPEREYELLEEPEVRPAHAPGIELASMSRRVLATVVDATLVAGACLVAAALAVNNSNGVPALRNVEIGTLAALLIAAAAYKVLFFTLARATPGMKYARIALCTFEGGIPTRTQRYARLAALLLSVVPVGLGFVWAIFDDQHLTWHDRITRTYLRIG